MQSAPRKERVKSKPIPRCRTNSIGAVPRLQKVTMIKHLKDTSTFVAILHEDGAIRIWHDGIRKIIPHDGQPLATAQSSLFNLELKMKSQGYVYTMGGTP